MRTFAFMLALVVPVVGIAQKNVVKPVPSKPEEPPEDAAPIHEAHKEFRHKHCTHWLRWSSELAEQAQQRVDEIAKACKVKPGNHPYGENIWSGTAERFPTRKVVEAWYAEGKRYNYKRPGYSRGTARFTQLVWHGSQRYGCATATCKRTTYWVCLYDPPGNVDGQFEENVKHPASCKE